MSLKRFAALSGMSEGLLSQIERGGGNPSLLTVQKIARAMDIPLAELFYRASNPPAPIKPGLEALPARLCAVITPAQRKKLVLPHELTYELLTPDLQRRLEMIRCLVPPGFDGSAMPFQHEGEECVHVLQGTFQAHVGDDVHDLGPGDTITLQSSLPHWWKNVGDISVEVICAVTPPSF